MVVENSNRFGENRFYGTWSKFEDSVSVALLNDASSPNLFYEGMFDFSDSPLDRELWTASGDVEFGVDAGRHVRIGAGGTITFKHGSSQVLRPPAGDWNISISLKGSYASDVLVIGLIDSKGTIIYKTFTEEYLGDETFILKFIDDEGVLSITRKGNVIPFMNTDTLELIGLYFACSEGEITINTVKPSWRGIEEQVSQRDTGISVANFNLPYAYSGTHPSGWIKDFTSPSTNRIEVYGTPSSTIVTCSSTASGVRTIYDGYVDGSALRLQLDEDDGIGLKVDMSEDMFVKSRIIPNASSHYTIGFSNFKIDVGPTAARVVDGDGNTIRDGILTYGATNTLDFFFSKRGENVNAEMKIEDYDAPVSAAVMDIGGKYNFPHKDPTDVFQIIGVETCDIYLDYILTGDQPWAHFM